MVVTILQTGGYILLGRHLTRGRCRVTVKYRITRWYTYNIINFLKQHLLCVFRIILVRHVQHFAKSLCVTPKSTNIMKLGNSKWIYADVQAHIEPPPIPLIKAKNVNTEKKKNHQYQYAPYIWDLRVEGPDVRKWQTRRVPLDDEELQDRRWQNGNYFRDWKNPISTHNATWGSPEGIWSHHRPGCKH